jgi:hypothetical protein
MTKDNPGVSKSTPQRKGERRPEDEKWRARIKKGDKEYFAGYAATETAAGRLAATKREQVVKKATTKKRGRRSTSGTGTATGTRSTR